MPQPRNAPSLSPERAAQALSILIHEGKLKAADVTRALRRRERLIRELTGRLSSLGHEVSGVAASLVGRRGRRATGRRSAKISKAQRAARKAQGHYLGAIRPLSKANRAKVKAIREKAGVRAAIATAKRIAARKSAPGRRPKKKPARHRPNRARHQRKPVSKQKPQPAAPAAPKSVSAG